MADVEVRLFKNGREFDRVSRPLRSLNGKPAVKYRRRLWPLINGCEVHLDGTGRPPPAEMPTEPVEEFRGAPRVPLEWDESQRDVINAPPEARLLVSAGPGTGKTAVACARVAKLIDRDGLEPNSIWLISFTRTAVREIRDRIAAYLGNAGAAYAVRIATLDSYAWAIHSGFDDEARILGSYEENIERVALMVREGGSVVDYLETAAHVVVDEAQDIVGVRADLVLAMVERLSDECGVTVFADEAQAIYGFANDEGTLPSKERQLPLPEKFRRFRTVRFDERVLTKVHRTSSPHLLGIFTDTRRKLLAPTSGPDTKLATITADVIRLGHGSVPTIERQMLAKLADAFILYRRRCEVLLASSFLRQSGIQHRIRMSGLPVCIMPWVGLTLSEYTKPSLNKETFIGLWADRFSGVPLSPCDADEAWNHLVRVAGRTRGIVEMRLLRQRLGRKQPPAEMCSSEVGNHGPIVGTIHASKGREADVVHLMLPGDSCDDIDQDEEARIVFVGATRGRVELRTGRGYRQYARRVESSGRVYSPQVRDSRPRAQVEIGRDGDLIAEGLAGCQYFDNAGEVRAGQSSIRAFVGGSVSVMAEADRAVGFAYRLRQEGQDRCFAVLSQEVNHDLFSIGQAVQAMLGARKLRPPDTIQHLCVASVRTIVLPPDAPECERLHNPWATSGIILAPVVLGYTTLYFPRQT